MKKWILGLVVFLLILLAAVYILVPGTATISAATSIRSSHAAAIRVLADKEQWKQWWPDSAANGLQFNGNSYSLEKNMFQSFLVNINYKKLKLESILIMLPLKRDSFEIEWKSKLPTGSNPFTRYRRYVQARSLQNDLHELLAAFKIYVEESRNVYGETITETTVKDSIILVSTATSGTYPTIQQVYSQVNELKNFASQKGLKQTNFPMLNIHKEGRAFISRVGLPINSEAPVSGTTFTIKRMVLGYILVSEVKGGFSKIEKMKEAMEQYMSDYKRKAPAIPYESLVTDRSAEPDSGKWITRLYYPVY